ncbi:unnamed protein product [Polarella glacialis]|uniref:Calcineurin-like phosphoesterase domain-containing protein n=1 Tax=Polarella glacialis TaxID=89957 RepID=A0A813D0T0_POLGL|nr:unnamed protein product [Polarella glacialis]
MVASTSTSLRSTLRGLLIVLLAVASASGSSECAGLDDPKNAPCRKAVAWAAVGGKKDAKAQEYFGEMKSVTGVDWADGTEADFQRLYFCGPPGGKAQCGLPPCTCSKPPCGTCYADGFAPPPPLPPRPGCTNGKGGIQCEPPSTAMGYKGLAWPSMSFSGKQEMHIFAIGDWGGLDGSHQPTEGRTSLSIYNGGKKKGPSVFPRDRKNKDTTVLLCHHFTFLQCYCDPPCPTAINHECKPGCGFVKGVDDRAQILVAKSMDARAAKVDPQYILNVGDNFYWGGIEKNCGTPMNKLSFQAHHQFTQIFEGVYNGPSLSGKPWPSVLGNHDWGGRVFNNGWDQQISYTWYSDRWILPAPYWSQHVEYPDLGFSVDIYMIDSNAMDALDPAENPSHNLCGQINPAGADCSATGGPSSVGTCKSWFRSFWAENQAWLEAQLPKSKADWQIVVTHFNCGHEQAWYKKLHQNFGLDLLVTGHRHDQELWDPKDLRAGDTDRDLGGLMCFVTGGGGGISSEATPNPADKHDWFGEGQYGFFDLTISKSTIFLQSINYDGTVLKEATLEQPVTATAAKNNTNNNSIINNKYNSSSSNDNTNNNSSNNTSNNNSDIGRV